MRTWYAGALVALAAVTAAPLAAQEGSAALTAREEPPIPAICADCHPEVTDRYLGALEHAAGVTCLSCHHIGWSEDPGVTEARRRDACVSCHADHAEVPATHVGINGAAPSCTDCHSIHGDPEPEVAGAAISRRCSSCHSDVRHTLHADVASEAPLCTDCHTMHTGEHFAPEEADLYRACGHCHQDVHPTHSNVGDDFRCAACHPASPPPDTDTSSRYVEQCDVCHGDIQPTHARVVEGAPSCLACHDFGVDGAVATIGPIISGRCEACHEDVLDRYRHGGHAAGLAADPNPDLPTCVTCHPSHLDPGEKRANLRLAATVRCVECHSRKSLMDKYGLPVVTESYEDDFHGATARFLWEHPEVGEELPRVLVCSDCHGPHEVGWNQAQAVADVCRRCHKESDAKLAGAWLGHTDVGPRNKPLIFLVKLFYYVLIPFMLGGLFLNIMFHLTTERRHGARVMKAAGMRRLIARLKGNTPPMEETVTRFSFTDRWDHLGSAVTFILLVVTGLPQTQPDLPAAEAFIGFLGGIERTRIIHRTVGFLFVALVLIHVGRIVVRAIRGKRLPVMVPTRKDFEDAIQTFRHYLRGEKKARFGKFDFGEKFEYWGLFLGGVVMSATGLILVFPELVTHFLPGIVVAATRVIHGFEATFAVMVVILWHSWGVILRPEIFPLDTSIFTGKIPVSRLKHEHPLEYESIFPDRVAAEPDEEETGPVLPGPGERLQDP